MQNRTEANRRFLSDHQRSESGTFYWSRSLLQTLRSAAWSWSFPSILATWIFKNEIAYDCILYAWIYLYNVIIYLCMIIYICIYMHTIRPILTTVLDFEACEIARQDTTKHGLVPMRRRLCPLWPRPFERWNGRVCEGMQVILPWQITSCRNMRKLDASKRIQMEDAYRWGCM